MLCPIQDKENAEILLDYCDRKLGPELMARLDRHVAECPECARVLSAQRAVWEALDAWTPEPVSPDFNRRLYARIENQPAGFWSRMAQRFPIRPAIPMAAAATVVLAAFLIQVPQPAGSTHPVAGDPIDAEQVETALEDMEMLRQLGVG
jgi:anti-sigma factor RsiW